MCWVTWLLCNGYGWRVKAGVRRRCKKVRVIVIYRFPLRPFVQLSEDRRKTGTLGFFVYPAQWCLDTVQLVFTVFGDVNSVRVYYACFFFLSLSLFFKTQEGFSLFLLSPFSFAFGWRDICNFISQLSKGNIFDYYFQWIVQGKRNVQRVVSLELL